MITGNGGDGHVAVGRCFTWNKTTETHIASVHPLFHVEQLVSRGTNPIQVRAGSTRAQLRA
jgi:hypothetical protein